MKKSRMR